MSVGDVVNVSTLRLKSELTPGTFIESTVKANRGKAMVVLLLGEEDLSGKSKVDPSGVMRRMGWQRIEDAAENWVAFLRKYGWKESEGSIEDWLRSMRDKAMSYDKETSKSRGKEKARHRR